MRQPGPGVRRFSTRNRKQKHVVFRQLNPGLWRKPALIQDHGVTHYKVVKWWEMITNDFELLLHQNPSNSNNPSQLYYQPSGPAKCLRAIPSLLQELQKQPAGENWDTLDQNLTFPIQMYFYV